MSYQLQFIDAVLADIKGAKGWYKEQREGLEEVFTAEIEICLHKILRTPAAYAVRYKNIRIAHPKRFPYNIHFYIDESHRSVVVTGIVHNRRNHLRVKKRA